MEAKKSAAKVEPVKAPARAAPRSFLGNDFPIIRAAAIGFAASLLFGGALVAVSSGLLEKWREVVIQRKQERSVAKARLAEALVERKELIEFRPAFDQLRRDGLVAEESRLDLMELLRRIQEERELLPLTYTVAAQEAFAVDPALPTGAMNLRGSKILLTLPLLHEMDLLNLLGDLKGHGLYAPESCNVKRRADALARQVAPQLEAECSLYWITMARRKDAAAAPLANR